MLPGQRIIYRDGKVTSHLCPVSISVDPGSELKSNRTGSEAENVGLRLRLLSNARMIYRRSF